MTTRPSPTGGVAARPAGETHVVHREKVRGNMKLLRTMAVVGIAKKLYDESRRPENQARIKDAVAKVRERRNRRGRQGS